MGPSPFRSFRTRALFGPRALFGGVGGGGPLVGGGQSDGSVSATSQPAPRHIPAQLARSGHGSVAARYAPSRLSPPLRPCCVPGEASIQCPIFGEKKMSLRATAWTSHTVRAPPSLSTCSLVVCV